MVGVIKTVCVLIVILTCCYSKNLHEATFTQDGIYNSHDNYVWVDQNPYATHVRSHLYRCGVNVWAASFIKKCKLNYPEVNECLVQRVKDLKPYLEKGIPEMKIPSLKPLRIPKAEIHTGNGFNADFTDLVITGAENFEIKKVDFNLDKHNAVMQLSIPKLRIQSTYNFNGKILILELSGSGLADANITNINAKVQTGIKKVNRKGKEYVDVEDGSPVISFDKPSLHFGDLFKGNEELTEHTNQVINDNIEEIGKEIKPLIDDTIHQFVHGIIKQIFDEYTVDELFD